MRQIKEFSGVKLVIENPEVCRVFYQSIIKGFTTGIMSLLIFPLYGQNVWYRVDKPGSKTCYFIDTNGNKAPVGEHNKLAVGTRFTEGLLCVNFSKNKGTPERWGCLNEKGDTAIKGLYLQPFAFSDGVAKVAIKSLDTEETEESMICEYINNKGVSIRDTGFECSVSTSMVNRWAIAKSGVYWYLLSNKGILKELSVDYEVVYPFSDGVARCRRINGYYAYIDSSRWPVLETTNENFVGDFVNGFAPYSTIKGKFGFINKKGVPVTACIYQEVSEFHEGVASVKLYDKWGAIDPKGKWVIQPVYAEKFTFSEGLAAVRKDKHFGYIDIRGNLVILPQFQQTTLFERGIAAASDSTGLWGYIRKNGDWMIKPRFLNATPFDSYGFAWVEYTDKRSYAKGVLKQYEKALIGKSGKVVWYSGEKLQINP